MERFGVGDVIEEMLVNPHYVYELIDAAGNVFYIGVTNEPRRRFRDHAQRTHTDVGRRMARGRCRLRILSIHDDREEAEAKETELIRQGRGLLNQVHTPGFGRPVPRQLT